ncbi:MAG: SRPBCC family protein [Steroidobacteraceae bacterium]|nr:SRPBCC family protein [Nevskiaceae bacterium]MCP5359125.1 SRPBCC family protein [Nevskiaceae bacterium]MCP5466359.1 SRPBCC family protein [Nevskiaceae bacterium]
MPGTVKLHRVLRAPAARVYRAFLDAGALVKWLPPNGYTGTVHSIDARVGGGYHMSFTHLDSGGSHSFRVEYLELEQDARIVHTDQFDDSSLPGTMQVTIVLTPVSCGTELAIVQEGIPDLIPTDQCYLGWQQSLALLALLVDAESSE